MFIDKRNEYPAESVAPREHHAELDYHNRRLQDKKKWISLVDDSSRRVTIISPVTNSAGDNQWVISDKLNSAGYQTKNIILTQISFLD